MRSLFETVCDIHYDNPGGFLYDMFADKGSLGVMLAQRGADQRTEVIYLATHGDENNVAAGANKTVSRTELRNLITTANGRGQIKGLYLGTCMTGNLNTAKFLLATKTKLTWLAGYSQSVDWIDGSAIDMIFMHKLTEQYIKNKSRRRGKLCAEDMAHNAATEMLKLVQGAHSNYGFNIYFKSNGSSSVQAMFL